MSPTALHTKITRELKKESNISIVELVDSIIEYAHGVRASDIRITPTEHLVRVRLRIDGVLQDVFEIPSRIHDEVVSRIKILSNLRTDEHQAAQDGRFRVILGGSGPVDIRVSITPTYHGENSVLRILADKSEQFTLEMLGFSKEDQEKILRAIKKPFGMILSTGPTGSGKTTTLYTLVKMLNHPDVSIITLEDPIEYAITGIEQIQISPRTNLTFANGLRSVLRQDPDIIMVGEIRDPETANLAVNTALTGHLLFSTLHTTDSSTSLPRLLDMGIEAYLIASTVNIVVGQRLVRRICPKCGEKHKLTELEQKSLEQTLPKDRLKKEHVFMHGVGCDYCNNSGYHGRIGINEVLIVDDDIRDAFLRRASSAEIKKIAVQNGMNTMLLDGFNKAVSGITTIEEILRVIHE
jgi:type II secretory ATPase GspE/PulE/Tfp pilus assembly ATPase PilB-like protein